MAAEECASAAVVELLGPLHGSSLTLHALEPGTSSLLDQSSVMSIRGFVSPPSCTASLTGTEEAIEMHSVNL